MQKLKTSGLKISNLVNIKKPGANLEKSIKMGMNHFAVLGVLSDLYIKYHPGTKWDDGLINSCAGYLPDIVAEWAGLYLHNPTICPKARTHRSATAQNDARKRSFKQIAALIKKNL